MGSLELPLKRASPRLTSFGSSAIRIHAFASWPDLRRFGAFLNKSSDSFGLIGTRCEGIGVFCGNRLESNGEIGGAKARPVGFRPRTFGDELLWNDS